MQAGNVFYNGMTDVPHVMPILSFSTVMLLPGGYVPVTITEPNFIRMIDDAMRGNRLIGLVLAKAPSESGRVGANDNTGLWEVGCVGRITNYSEVGNGQVLISLQGVCRFRLEKEITGENPYRLFQIAPFLEDLVETARFNVIDRKAFVEVFHAYLEMHQMQADWDVIADVSDETLVNALSVIVPFKPVEKQALLEAPDLKTRSETMIAIAERAIMDQNRINPGSTLQ
ncbi:MAG: Lon protease [Candidatus Tokpelaia hoelldobleri]|uniref:Lon protease n=1 Tax=Candidatus Tokpelaia hoelldobleri TaxID=1902579 RepID=A0A1U9JWW8_9HYPH|nr:MAG: Lon protease [Candidatus Tokpelaia hoelldoblerii]